MTKLLLRTTHSDDRADRECHEHPNFHRCATSLAHLWHAAQRDHRRVAYSRHAESQSHIKDWTSAGFNLKFVDAVKVQAADVAACII